MPKKTAKGGEVTVTLPRLHPGQVRIKEERKRFTVLMCGRRFGKTVFGEREVIEPALQGFPTAWFAPTYKYQLEVWQSLIRRLQPIISRSNEQERRIELVTGGVIELWTMDSPDPGLGRKYKRVILDEAGIVPELLTIWNRAIRPTLVDLRGDAYLLGTPRNRRHGFVSLFNRGQNPDDANWKSFRGRTLDNPYIPPEEVEEARREMTPELFLQEFEGIPTDDGMNPFGLEAIREAVEDMPIANLVQPPVVYGLDLARSVDYTVLCGLDAYRRVVALERWQAPWAETKTRIAALVGDTPVVADSTGVGDAIVADLEVRGVNVTRHPFTAASKLRLMQRLISAFQGRELTIPDGWLVAELEAFEYEYTATGVRYEAPKGLHDDGVMALGLALHGWDRVQGVVPEPLMPLPRGADDTNVGLDDSDVANMPRFAGDFATQLPGDW